MAELKQFAIPLILPELPRAPSGGCTSMGIEEGGYSPPHLGRCADSPETTTICKFYLAHLAQGPKSLMRNDPQQIQQSNTSHILTLFTIRAW